MEPKEKRAFEPTGLVPRSIVRTFERFRQQLLPGSEKAAIREYRISRYQVLVSARCLFVLITIPIATNWFVSSWLLSPIIEHFWNTQQNEIFLNSYQEERAFAELEFFSDKLFFESLLSNDSLNDSRISHTKNPGEQFSTVFAGSWKAQLPTSVLIDQNKTKFSVTKRLSLQREKNLSILNPPSVPYLPIDEIAKRSNLVCNPLGVAQTWSHTPLWGERDKVVGNFLPLKPPLGVRGQCKGVDHYPVVYPISSPCLLESSMESRSDKKNNQMGDCEMIQWSANNPFSTPALCFVNVKSSLENANYFPKSTPSQTITLLKNTPYLPDIFPVSLTLQKKRCTNSTSTNIKNNNETCFQNLWTKSRDFREGSNDSKAVNYIFDANDFTFSNSIDCLDNSIDSIYTSNVINLPSKPGIMIDKSESEAGGSADYFSFKYETPFKTFNDKVENTENFIFSKSFADREESYYPVFPYSLKSSKQFKKTSHINSLNEVTTRENSLKIQERIQEKILELAVYYNQQTILSITNIAGDFISVFTLGCLFIWMRPEISILKSFLIEAIYSLSDTTKSFLLILLTDLLVGFHSPRGWETALELLLKHFGLPENQDFVFLFVATFPVLLDTVFKYWIFRHLNKISPSTVATYHSMIE